MHLSTKVLRIAFEFIALLAISIYVHLQIRARNKLNCQSAMTRNLVTLMRRTHCQEELIWTIHAVLLTDTHLVSSRKHRKTHNGRRTISHYK
ncbi:hypothetical protein DICVIV_04376 [Dictyocaulus viviparus]|uniref:Uncharacterized protein n=1 Tax=Dictyocaulus viviparus TaxID=29172 RepID=A0A0D8Y035_DICVI|nr:hypothetical protein DICVIV_04376 [Dictyocaulus viviparus]